MAANCQISKNRLLAVHFAEGTGEEDRLIRAHVQQCVECRLYLDLIGNTDRWLCEWGDENPPAGGFELLLERIEAAEPLPAVVKKRNTVLPITPFLKILTGIAAMVGIILLLTHRLAAFSFWDKVRLWWVVEWIGPLGVAAAVTICAGVLITLALSPVLLWESQLRR